MNMIRIAQNERNTKRASKASRNELSEATKLSTLIVDGVPMFWVDHMLRIDGILVPVRFKTWMGEFGVALGAVYTCYKTGKVWHQPTGGERLDGPPPAYTQPIPTAARCVEDPDRHRAICKNIRAASKGEQRDHIPLGAPDNGAAFAGQIVRFGGGRRGGKSEYERLTALATKAVIKGKTDTVIIDEGAAFPTSAQDWSEIDAADGVTYDLEPIPSPYFYTDGQLCRRASMDMLRSLWACVTSLFRRVI